MGASREKLDRLLEAAKKYFDSEKKRLENEYSFLDSISKKRNGDVGKLKDVNDEGASKILEDSITEYLGKPLG